MLELLVRNNEKCDIQQFVSIQLEIAPTSVWYHQKAAFKYFLDQFLKQKYQMTHRLKTCMEEDPEQVLNNTFSLW